MEFIRTNLNPAGKAANDCVVRAIMKATGKTWTDVYLALCDIGVEIYDMPNSKKAYELYLKRQGWQKQKMPKEPAKVFTGYGIKESYRRLTVKEFAEKNSRGTFIVSVANHLTVVIDGILIDSWNCAYKSVGNYFIK